MKSLLIIISKLFFLSLPPSVFRMLQYVSALLNFEGVLDALLRIGGILAVLAASLSAVFILKDKTCGLGMSAAGRIIFITYILATFTFANSGFAITVTNIFMSDHVMYVMPKMFTIGAWLGYIGVFLLASIIAEVICLKYSRSRHPRGCSAKA